MKRGAILACSGCQRPTRPSRSSLADYPDTIARYGGRCMSCYAHEAKTGPGRATVEQNHQALEQYMCARREREAAALRRENPYRRTA